MVLPFAADPDDTDDPEAAVLPFETDPASADDPPEDVPPHPANETATAAANAIAVILFLMFLSPYTCLPSSFNEFVRLRDRYLLLSKKSGAPGLLTIAPLRDRYLSF